MVFWRALAAVIDKHSVGDPAHRNAKAISFFRSQSREFNSVTVGAKQPVDGGGAHGVSLLPYRRLQDQFLMAFQGLHQIGEKELPALGADLLAGLLQGSQGDGGFKAGAPCPDRSGGSGR